MFEKYEKQFALVEDIEKVTLEEYTNPKRKGPKAFTEQWKGFKPTLHG